MGRGRTILTPGAVLRCVFPLLAAWLVAYEVRVVAGIQVPLLGQNALAVVVAAGGALCVARAWCLEYERTAWALIGAGFLLWALGDVYYLARYVSAPIIPVPSPADAGYLAMYPCALAGVGLLVRRSRRRSPVIWLDGLAAGLSGAALSAAVVFEAVARQVHGSTASVATNLAYPFGDLMLIGLVVGAMAMRGWRIDRRAGLLALGMVAFWIADSVFLAHPTSAETPFDVGWALAPVLAAWAAWQAPPTLPADDESSAAVALPLGFAGLSLAMLFAAGLVSVSPLAVALAAASQLAVVGRLALTFREHRAAVAAERRAQEEQRRLQERLERSQRLETVGQLAGGIAHDFNNLLAVVLNCVDLVRDGVGEGDAAHDDLDTIESAAHRGARLTRQLLLFGQRNAVSAEILDVAEVVSTTCAMLARTLGEHVALEWSPGAATWRAEVDRGNIEQVVANLVLNARDALGPGGTITVTTGNERLDRARAADVDVAVGPYIRLTVTDDGCGMAPELLARVFEPFVTTKPPGVGTGLGLATVYGVVRQAGGGVHVESEVGRGTTFDVYLPAALTLPASEPTRPPARADGGTGQRVLIVEDEPPLREALERIVARAGYAVDTAASGEEALRRAGGNVYDLVVTDMVMPGMTGHELAQRLRGADPGQRVLYVSGYSPDLLERQGASAPAPLLLKPFTAEALLRHVGEALGGR